MIRYKNTGRECWRCDEQAEFAVQPMDVDKWWAAPHRCLLSCPQHSGMAIRAVMEDGVVQVQRLR